MSIETIVKRKEQVAKLPFYKVKYFCNNCNKHFRKNFEKGRKAFDIVVCPSCENCTGEKCVIQDDQN